jgi:hypothetical protein
MTEKTTQKTFRQVCTCEKCGNEAEMIITCSLEPVEEETRKEGATGESAKQTRKKIPGQATCTHCGNEAEILIDI